MATPSARKAEIEENLRIDLHDAAMAAKKYPDWAVVYEAVMSGTYHDITHALERAKGNELTAREMNALRVTSRPDAGPECQEAMEQIRLRKLAFKVLLRNLRKLQGRLRGLGVDIDQLLSQEGMRPDVEW